METNSLSVNCLLVTCSVHGQDEEVKMKQDILRKIIGKKIITHVLGYCTFREMQAVER